MSSKGTVHCTSEMAESALSVLHNDWRKYANKYGVNVVTSWYFDLKHMAENKSNIAYDLVFENDSEVKNSLDFITDLNTIAKTYIKVENAKSI